MSNKIDKKKNIAIVVLKEFIRIKDVIGWSAFSFFGFLLGLSSLDLYSYLVPFFVFFITTFCIMSFTFAMNNYYDADSDRENPRRRHINAIASGKISKQTGAFLNITFVIIPLVVSILFKIEIFLLCIVFLFWMWSYSAPPLRLKGRPGMDVIWHFFAFVLIVLWGSSISGSIELINWLAAVSLGVFSCVAQVGNHISDYSFDKDSGTKTFAVWVGLDRAKIAIQIITLLHLILLIPLIFLYTLSYSISIIIAIIIPIIGFLILRPGKGAFPTRRCYIYFFTMIVGCAIYLSCLIYYINFLLGKPTLDLLNVIGIP